MWKSLVSIYLSEIWPYTSVYMCVLLAWGHSLVVETLTIKIKPSNTLTRERWGERREKEKRKGDTSLWVVGKEGPRGPWNSKAGVTALGCPPKCGSKTLLLKTSNTPWPQDTETSSWNWIGRFLPAGKLSQFWKLLCRPLGWKSHQQPYPAMNSTSYNLQLSNKMCPLVQYWCDYDGVTNHFLIGLERP